MIRRSRISILLATFLAAWTCSFLWAGPGTKIYNELLDTDGFYKENGWPEYVDRIGRKLLKYAKPSKRDFYFFVVDSPGVNAFATPDGYIFVNRGLLMFLESEDQLAAVIGHEIGHVIAEHGAKQRHTDLLGSAAGFVATLLTGRTEMMDVSDATTKALLAGYGREMELEADEIGAQIIARAGYNPLAVIDALQVLKDQSLFASEVRGQPATYHGLFATHPQNDKRLQDIVNYATQSLPEDLNEPLDDFWTLMDGMKFGSEANTGLLAQNVFFDKGARLVIEFPINWFVRFNADQVTGEAKGGPSVAWATITRHVKDDAFNPERFVRDTLKRSDIKEEKTVQANGRNAHLVELEMGEKSDAYGLLGVVELGQHVYTIRGETGKKGDKEQFEKDFMTILSGIRDMKPSDIQEDITTKIRVIVADPGMTYEKLATATPLKGHAPEILRLLNGDYPRGEPRAGDFIKIVQ